MTEEVTSSGGGTYWGNDDDRARYIREKMRAGVSQVEARKMFEDARQRKYGR